MTRDSRYDVLFEPVRIGPLTARNRFYQVPHCNGMGYRDVSALATMRGIKAEGGWAVVCTEMVEIHYGADVAPYVELRIWDDQDIPALALIADKIHAHGALAGIELCHSGYTAVNLYSREPPMAPPAMNASSYHFDPVQARAMDKEDIKNLRRAHRAAALRARAAGYDVYAVLDASGDPSEMVSRISLARFVQGGVKPTSTNALLSELHRTWARPEAAELGKLYGLVAPNYAAVAESYARAQQAAREAS